MLTERVSQGSWMLKGVIIRVESRKITPNAVNVRFIRCPSKKFDSMANFSKNCRLQKLSKKILVALYVPNK